MVCLGFCRVYFSIQTVCQAFSFTVFDIHMLNFFIFVQTAVVRTQLDFYLQAKN